MLFYYFFYFWFGPACLLPSGGSRRVSFAPSFDPLPSVAFCSRYFASTPLSLLLLLSQKTANRALSLPLHFYPKILVEICLWLSRKFAPTRVHENLFWLSFFQHLSIDVVIWIRHKKEAVGTHIKKKKKKRKTRKFTNIRFEQKWKYMSLTWWGRMSSFFPLSLSLSLLQNEFVRHLCFL